MCLYNIYFSGFKKVSKVLELILFLLLLVRLLSSLALFGK